MGRILSKIKNWRRLLSLVFVVLYTAFSNSLNWSFYSSALWAKTVHSVYMMHIILCEKATLGLRLGTINPFTLITISHTGLPDLSKWYLLRHRIDTCCVHKLTIDRWIICISIILQHATLSENWVQGKFLSKKAEVGGCFSLASWIVNFSLK